MFDSSSKEKHPICEEWMKYYETLENIRRSGVCNMWGAAPYLKAFYPELGEQKSIDILLSWITNYNELNKRFSWQ